MRVITRKEGGRYLTVLHPDTRRAFPTGRPFTLTDADLNNPRILRLLPRDVPGGVFGDLVPADSKSDADKSKASK